MRAVAFFIALILAAGLVGSIHDGAIAQDNGQACCAANGGVSFCTAGGVLLCGDLTASQNCGCEITQRRNSPVTARVVPTPRPEQSEQTLQSQQPQDPQEPQQSETAPADRGGEVVVPLPRPDPEGSPEVQAAPAPAVERNALPVIEAPVVAKPVFETVAPTPVSAAPATQTTSPTPAVSQAPSQEDAFCLAEESFGGSYNRCLLSMPCEDCACMKSAPQGMCKTN
jgi:hypothetical protein